MTPMMFHHRPALTRLIAKVLLALSIVTAANLQFAIPIVEAATGIYKPIHYQGKVALSNGTAVSNGSYNMRFRIFDAATNGTQLWSETWDSNTTRVTMTGGLFSVQLGSIVTMTGSVNFNTDNLYLEINFDPGNDDAYEETFSPRRRFASVPFAHNADALDGLDSTKFLRRDIAQTLSGAITVQNGLTVAGTLSGAIIHASSELRSSGSLIVQGTTRLKSYASCGLITTDSNGNLGCAGSALSTSTGALQATFDNRYIRRSGGSMTGGLIITNGNPAATIDAGLLLEIAGTASGRILHAQDELHSSGSLSIEGSTFLQGTVRFTGLNCTGNTNGGTLTASADGTISCTDDDSGGAGGFGTGNVLTIGNTRYVSRQGGSMTGGLIITSGNPAATIDAGLLLEIAGAMSGRTIHAQDLLRSSGSLIVQSTGLFKGNLTTRGTLSGASLHISGGTRTNSGIVINRPEDSAFLTLKDSTNGRAIDFRTGSGTPNGVTYSGSGSLYFDTQNARVYAKTAGAGTTQGWTMISTGTGAPLPSRATLWHDESTVIAGNALLIAIDASQRYATYSYQNPPANNDAFTNGFLLRAGVYTFSTLGVTSNSYGKIDWYIDGVLAVSGQDWYSAGATYNVVKTATVTVTGDGYHVLKGVINGKNGSSSNYLITLTQMSFIPGADNQSIGVNSNAATLNQAYGNDDQNGGARITLTGDDDSIEIFNPVTGGTHSGAVLYITNNSGSQIGLDLKSVAGTAANAGLRISTNGANHILFGTGGTTYDTNLYRSAANRLKTDDSLWVAGTLSGAALTIMGGNSSILGNLMIGSSAAAGSALEIAGTASGRILHAQDELHSSGSLSIEGSTFLQGTIKFTGLNCTGNANGGTLTASADGTISCTDDDSGGAGGFGTGNVLTIGDQTYVRQGGDTMTGGLLIQSGTLHGTLPTIDAGLLLEIAGTASGRILHAQDLLRSSGSLIVQTTGLFKGNLTTRSILSGASLHVLGGTRTNSGIVINRPQDTAFLTLKDSTNGRALDFRTGSGTPNGIIDSGSGSLYFDTQNARIYAKTAGAGTTQGWTMITTGTGAPLPSRATLWYDESTVVAGSDFTHTLDANQRYGTYTLRSSPANGDSFTNGFLLRAGTYTFSTLGVTHSIYGKIDWYIDGVLAVSGQDWYSAGLTYNVIKTATVTVTGDGYHVLKGVLNGKNGSSSGYSSALTQMYFTPASDNQSLGVNSNGATLNQAYGNDDQNGGARITLTGDDDSIEIFNPVTGGTHSGAVLYITNNSGSQIGLDINSVAGTAANAGLRISTNGANHILFGTGATTYDTNLYRQAANRLRTDDSLWVAGTLSGAALTIMGGNSSILGNLMIGSSAAAGSALEIAGTASGRILHAQDELRSSGSLAVDGTTSLNGTVKFTGLNCTGNTNGGTLTASADGTISCTDDDSGGAGGFGTGNVLTIGNTRYVSRQGGSMTGGLIITSGNPAATIDAGLLLEIAGAMSGRTIHAQDILRSSGSLSVDGATYLQGSVTMTTLTSCEALQTSSNGALSCAGGFLRTSTGALRTLFDQRYLTSSTGALQTTFDNRFLRRSGGSMTGGLIITSGNPAATIDAGLLLEIAGTMSGRTIHAQDLLRSSGSLIVQTTGLFKGNLTTRGTLSGASLHISGGTRTNSGIVISRPEDSAFLTLKDSTNGRALDFRTGSGTPNGVMYSGSGSLYFDTQNARVYAKTAGAGTTQGWTMLSTGTGAPLPSRATLWHDQSTSTSGGAFTTTPDPQQLYNSYTTRSVFANGDAFTNGFLLRAGTYTFSALGASSTNRGKIDWYIDGVLAVSGQDWYSGSGLYNVTKTATVTVTGDGYHVLKGVINGKNGSSSDYAMLLTSMWFTPTGGDNQNIGVNSNAATLNQAYGNDDAQGGAQITLTTDDDSIAIINPATNGTDSGALLYVTNLAAGKIGLDITNVSGAAANAGLRISTNGANHILFGTGGTTYDTNLYRSAANRLKTDDSLWVAGTLSGAALTVSNLRSCDTIDTDASGNLVCGTDGGGSGGAFGTGNVLTIGNTRYVSRQGGSMTGGLIITSGNPAATIDAGLLLEIAGAMSGRTIHAQDLLRSSGSLSVDGATYLQGSVTMTTLTSCEALQTSSNGALSCAGGFLRTSTGALRTLFDQRYLTSSTGALQTTFDNRFLRRSGGSMTGGLIITSGNPAATIDAGLLLEIAGAMSGRTIHAQDLLRSSGSLIVQTTGLFKGNLTTRGTLSGASLHVSGGTRTNSGIVISRPEDSAFLTLKDSTNGRALDFRTGSGTPNGVMYSGSGSLYFDTQNARVYAKTAGAGTTQGWTMLSTGTGAPLPSRATLWHDESKVTVGNALASFDADANTLAQTYDIFSYQNAAANGDTFTNGFLLRAGTYTFSVLGITSSGHGKIDWYIDGVLVTSGQDWYSASAVPNVVKTATVTVTGDGYHVLKGVVNGKNGSSSAYSMPLTKMWFTPTSDNQSLGVNSNGATLNQAYGNDDQNGGARITLTGDDDSIEIFNPVTGGTHSGAVLYITNNSGSQIGFDITSVSGTAANAGLRISTNGANHILFGTGSSTYDTNLYRQAANRLRTDDSLWVAGTLSGAALTIMGGNSSMLGNLMIGSSAAAGSALEIAGTASGRILHAQDELRSSGSLSIEGSTFLQGTVRFTGLNCTGNTNGGTLTASADGTISCTDDDSGGAGGFGTGNVLTIGNTRYVSRQGGSMTGGLIITSGNPAATIDAGLLLEIAGTMSGRTIHAQDLLRSSGSLIVQTTGLFKGNLTTRGTLSGASLHISGGTRTNSGIVINRPEDSAFLTLKDSTNGRALDFRTGSGTPNGIINSGSGSLYFDTQNARVYAKTAGAGTTQGWTMITSGTGAPLPTRAEMWHDESTVVTGGALVRTTDVRQRYATYTTQAGADGESFTNSFLLRAGTYTFSVLGAVSTDTAKVDWYIDGVQVVSGQDWYGALAWSTTQTATVTVTGDGYHVLKGVVNGKNGSSSSYNLYFTKMYFTPTTDNQSIGVNSNGATLNQAYGNDDQNGGARITLTGDDDSIEIFNPVTGGTHSGALLYITNNSGSKLGLDITSVAGSAANAGLRISTKGSNHILFGTGGTTYDTNLYRSAANRLKTDDSLWVAGTLSGAALTIMGGNSSMLGNLMIGSSAAAGSALEIAGTASGRILHAQDRLVSSGSFIVQGTDIVFRSFLNCTALETSSTGALICGSDGGGGTGLAIEDGDLRYVNTAGDTMTGALVIDGAVDALQFRIQGPATQTLDLFVAENDVGTDMLTLNADGDLHVSSGALIVSRTVAIGGIAEQVYNAISASAGATHSAPSEIEDKSDLFIEGSLEIDGLSFFDNRMTVTRASAEEFIRLAGNNTGDSVGIYSGSSAPEGAATAQLGSLFLNTGDGKFYLKATGDDTNTGWQELATTSSSTALFTNADARYVKKQGDTMTGALIIDAASDALQFRIQAATDQTLDLLVAENSDGTDMLTLNADGDLHVSSGALIVSRTVAIGGVGEQLYSAISTSAGATHTAASEIEDRNDLYIEGALEVDGLSFFDNRMTVTRASAEEFIRLAGSNTGDSVGLYSGSSSPEGSATAQLGSLFMNSGDGKLYVKSSEDDTSTGWSEVATLANGGLTTAIADNRYVKKQGDTMTGALIIDGAADVLQFRVQSATDQTADLFVAENSDGADLITLNADGDLHVSSGALLVSRTIAVGGVGEQLYSAISTSATASHTSASEIEDRNDLYIEGAFEIDGLSFFDNRMTVTRASGEEFLRLAGSNTADSVGLYSGSSAPEGGVTAQLGSLFMDSTSGKFYLKASGDDTNTGWSEIASTAIALTTETADARYVKRQGDTMTGGLLISAGGGTIGGGRMLEVVGAMSGSSLVISGGTKTHSGIVIRQPSSSNYLNLFDTTSDRAAGIFSGSGSPFSIVNASSGSLYMDNYKGRAYLNIGGNSSGWKQLLVGTATGSTYPDRATLWHDESTVIEGNALTLVHDTADNYATHSGQDPPADGNTFTNGFLLRAGTYTFSTIGISAPAYGMIDWYIDGELAVSGQDWYSAGGVYNVTMTASVTVTGDGYHVLKGVVNGKNASSSNYYIILTKMWFTPAIDETHRSPGADYAEWFRASPSRLRPGGQGFPVAGDLVCIDPLEQNTIKLCENEADPNVMGIVSTNPSFIGNDVFGTREGIVPPGYALIGLIGQLPAKTLVESGAIIRPGDSLTPASKPGYARKAMAGEPTVGVALQGLSEGEGVINVLVARRNGSLTSDAVSDRVMQTIKDLRIEEDLKVAMQESMQSLSSSGAFMQPITQEVQRQLQTQVAALGMQTVTDRLTSVEARLTALSGSTMNYESGIMNQDRNSQFFIPDSFTGSLTASTLDLEDTLSTGGDARIGGDLYLEGMLNVRDLFVPGIMQVDGALETSSLRVSSGAVIDGALTLNGNLNLASGSTLAFGSGASLDISTLMVRGALQVMGPVTIHGLAQFLGDVEVQGELAVSARQTGQAFIPQTGTSVTIHFDPPLRYLPVVTASPDVPVLYAVTKVTATGFTIRISPAATEPVTFSWFAVGMLSPLTADLLSTSVSTGSSLSSASSVSSAYTGSSLSSGSSASSVSSLGTPIAFPVDELGVPVSSSDAWNGCIRNHPPLQPDGSPVNCWRYREGYVWEHPDLMIQFTYNTSVTPALLMLPEGYEVVMEGSEGADGTEGTEVGSSSSSEVASSSSAASSVSSAEVVSSSSEAIVPDAPVTEPVPVIEPSFEPEPTPAEEPTVAPAEELLMSPVQP